MRTIFLVLLTLAACTSDESTLSPIEGAWEVTLTPVVDAAGCVGQGILAPDLVQSVFTVVETDDGPLVNAGQTEPGVTEFYVFGQLGNTHTLEITSYYDDTMEGHVSLRVRGDAVTGHGQVQVYDPSCLQNYTADGHVSRD